MDMKRRPKTKAELSKKSGVSPRMIAYILSKERAPSIEVTDALASAFGLTGWQIIMPNLSVEAIRNGKLEKLINDYSRSSDSGKELIETIADHEARLGKIA